jgi:branched-chain amino acid aminotransferase
MPDDYIQANTSGRLHDAVEPSLSPLNRGFLYGDAIYEVWRTYHGVIFAFEEHWRRLERSAAALFLPLPFKRGELVDEICRTAAAFRRRTGNDAELYLRLQITRGAGAIGLDVALADRPVWVLLVRENHDLSDEQRRCGLRLSLATGLRRNHATTLNPAWKTGNHLNNLLCLHEARARGADEVVIINLAGEVTEAAVSNIFFVHNGTLITPPLGAGILEGVTRGLVLAAVARAAGLSVREETVRPEDFAQYQECFLCSTTKDVVPVSAIDGQVFDVSPPAALWRLKTAFAAHARAHAAQHPELKLA